MKETNSIIEPPIFTPLQAVNSIVYFLFILYSKFQQRSAGGKICKVYLTTFRCTSLSGASCLRGVCVQLIAGIRYFPLGFQQIRTGCTLISKWLKGAKRCMWVGHMSGVFRVHQRALNTGFDMLLDVTRYRKSMVPI